MGGLYLIESDHRMASHRVIRPIAIELAVGRLWRLQPRASPPSSLVWQMHAAVLKGEKSVND